MREENPLWLGLTLAAPAHYTPITVRAGKPLAITMATHARQNLGKINLMIVLNNDCTVGAIYNLVPSYALINADSAIILFKHSGYLY